MKKVALLMLKATPVFGAFCCAANSLLSYFGYNLAWLGYAMRIFFILTWFALAKVFNFCSFYKMLVGYIVVIESLTLIDYHYPLPVSNLDYFVLNCSITGIFILLATFAHVRDTKKVKRHLEEIRRQS